MKTGLVFFAFVSLVSLGGCAAPTLHPGARKVIVTRAVAPEGCTYIGSVVGEQGGSLTGAYTSNANLAEGAFNDMKNKAHAMGANYVVLEDTHAGSTVNKGSGGQTDVTHMGNAFYCPESGSRSAGQRGPTGANGVTIVGAI